MKKKNILVSLLVAASSIGLVACTTGGQTETPSTSDVETNEDAEIVAAAKQALTLDSEFSADFTVPTVSSVGGVAIAWTSSNPDVAAISGGEVTVTRPGFSANDVEVTLTATLVKGTATTTKEFTVTIKKLQDESISISTLKSTGNKDQTYSIKGIVSGFAYTEAKDATNNKTNADVRSGMYITDSTGTIYVYGPSAAAEVAKGDEVYVTAAYNVRYGMPQLQSPAVEKLDENKTPDFTAVVKDMSVSDVLAVTLPNAETASDTTIHGTVYELVAKVKVSVGSTYVTYNFEDPNDASKYLSQYFSSSPAPEEETEFTKMVNPFDGKVCKIRYVVTGTNGSYAKWRGHVLSIEDLSDADKAKVEAEAIAAQLTVPELDEAKEITVKPTYDNSTLEITVNTDVCVYDAENKKFTITPASEAATTTVTIKATIGTETSTQTVTINTKKRVWRINTPIKNVEAGKEYTAYITQAGLDKILYSTGAVSGYYGVTTENPAEAIKIAAEVVEGGYNLYYIKDEKKVYINLVQTTAGKANVKFEETASSIWTFVEEYSTFKSKCADGTEFYLGTYNTFTTISASAISYIAGATNYALKYYEVTELSFDPEVTSFDVTFNVDGGSEITKQEVLYGKLATKPAEDPTKSGFNFAGYYADAAFSKAFDFATMTITDATTIYVKWSDLSVYDVTFHNVDEAPQKITEGETATKPAEDPKKNFYTFGGWYSDEACTTEFDFTTPITSATDIYAKWEEVAYSAYADYMKLENNQADVYVRGYIVLKASTNKDTFISDGAGNYFYVYGENDVIKNAEVGTEILVKGTISVYNNLYEIKPTLVEATTNTNTTISPVDITEDVTTKGFTTTSANQNRYITVTGTLTGASELTVGSTKIVLFTKGAGATALTGLEIGSKVTIKGIQSINKTTSQIVIWEADGAQDVTTDADRVAMLFAKLDAQIPTERVDAAKEITLATREGATVTVTPQAEQTIVTYADGKLSINPTSTSTEITVSITVTINDATDTKNYTITAFEKTDEEKAQVILDAIEAKMPTTKVISTQTIDIDAVEGATITVTPQAEQTVVTYADNKLTITPPEVKASYTVKVEVKINEATVEKTFTIEAEYVKIEIKTATLAHSSTTTVSTLSDGSNEAATVGLDATVFNVVFDKGGNSTKIGLNKDGTVRLYAGSGNGSSIIISLVDTAMKIKSIKITFGGTVGAFTVNGVEGSKDTAEYTIDANSVTIKNVQATGTTQVYIKSIEITYED